MNKQCTLQAFTLIEMLVALAIVAILLSLALPQYDRYMQRAHRVEGIEVLQKVLAEQERYYSQNRAYTIDLTELGWPAQEIVTAKGWYKIIARPCAQLSLAICVELLAQALGKQVDDGDLIVNSQGKQIRGNNQSW